MPTPKFAGALALALAAALLSGCDAINTYTAGALHYGETNTASAVANATRANVDAVELWKTAACALTVGGLANAGDAVASTAALEACPIPGVGTITVSNGGVTVKMGTSLAATAAPIPAAPPAVPTP
jgi:hypothetical protein